jgi:hypothetical protein
MMESIASGVTGTKLGEAKGYLVSCFLGAKMLIRIADVWRLILE